MYSSLDLEGIHPGGDNEGNRNVKEAGVWKILSIKWVVPYAVRITDDMMPPPSNLAAFKDMPGPKPDIPMDLADLRYVKGYILPFHFKHPVTSKETTESLRNARLAPLESE